MKKFEYMVFDIDTVNEPEDIFLNKMGADGWELIAIVLFVAGFVAFDVYRNSPLIQNPELFKKK